MQHEDYMKIAIEEALKGAESSDEVPVGAVVVREGEVIARAHNLKESNNCAVFHAEIVAIMRACEIIGNWYLDDCVLYVTLEPCPMCAGAMVNSRIKSLYYGASDPKSGACGSLMALNADARLNYNFNAQGGILAEECAMLLSDFFRRKRSIKKQMRDDKNNDKINKE